MNADLPDHDFRELDRWILTPDLALRFYAAATVVFIAALLVFGSLFSLSTGTAQASIGLAQVATACVLSLGIFALHELVHGLAIVLCGARPRYGAGMKWFLPYLYTTTDAVADRNEFLLIAVAPVILISVLGAGFIMVVPPLAGWAVIPLALNLAGSVGDLWAARILLRYPLHVKVKDDRAGMTIFGRAEDASLKQPPGEFFSSFLRGSVLTFLAVVLAAALLPIPLALLGIKEFALGAHQGIFRIESVSGSGYQISILGVIVLGIAAGTLVGFIYASAKSGRPRT
jgi:hypothetical protein